MASTAFFEVPRESVSTTSGAVDLPILYYRLDALYAFWTVDASVADELLTGTGLRAVRGPRARALFGLAFYDYHDTTIGPYHEVGTALAVHPGATAPLLSWLDLLVPARRRRLGFYILDLPVSTEVACAAGRELWGYPKFVTDLPFSVTARTASCAVADPAGGPPLVSLEGPIGMALSLPGFDLVLYSQRGPDRLRTQVDVRGTMSTSFGRSLRLTCKAGSSHPMAERISRLGIAARAPLLVQWGRSLSTRLNAGVVVGGA
jgi:hypothetical protein